jgi:hypothetical protein
MGVAADRRAARGRKNKKKNMSPVFQGKKTKNLRFRVFFASLSLAISRKLIAALDQLGF